MLDIKMEVGHSAETAFGTIVERTYFLKEISIPFQDLPSDCNSRTFSLLPKTFEILALKLLILSSSLFTF